MPFPHVERSLVVVRPAIVVAVRDTGVVGTLLWVMMVTNAARREWRSDILIEDWEAQGLLIPSKIRTAKISTVEAGQADRLGHLHAATWRAVADLLAAAFPDPA